jgi:hypothetical protein
VLRGKGLVALVLGLGLFGCGTDAGSTAGPVNTAYGAVATTQPRWTPAQQEVVDAYLAAVDAEVKASAVSDANDPALVTTHSGPLLAGFQRTFSERRAAGEAGHLPAQSKFRVDVDTVTIDAPGSATVVECTIDDAVVSVEASGSVVNDRVTSFHLTATVEKNDGHWQVTDRHIDGQRNGDSGCAGL